MSEQGQSPVLTVYHCPKCGSESLERHPCIFDCHDGRDHGRVEREPVEYILATSLSNREAEVERLTAELGNQEAVMVAADRLWTAYQAMLDGEDVGGLPDWVPPHTSSTGEGFNAKREEDR